MNIRMPNFFVRSVQGRYRKNIVNLIHHTSIKKIYNYLKSGFIYKMPSTSIRRPIIANNISSNSIHSGKLTIKQNELITALL